ncbi:hypothetical protein C3495_01055 [Clostridiaceae bacterium 14S0207]|nr:hypothetical protein C3495_01055 [Clostridiaceae bacterium 14S0207]
MLMEVGGNNKIMKQKNSKKNKVDEIDEAKINEIFELIKNTKMMGFNDGITTIGYGLLSTGNVFLANKIEETVKSFKRGNEVIPSFEIFNKAIDVLLIGSGLTLIGHANALPYMYEETRATRENPPFYINECLKEALDLELLSQILFVYGDIFRLQAFNLLQKGAFQAVEKSKQEQNQ